jgi:transcriptional regulator with XRE-family HTH domain
MDKQELILQIRKKKLGLLIADARIAVERSQEVCAKIMGVSLNEYQEFEKGNHAPSLPQIETLAVFLNVPMQHFRGKSSLSEKGFWEEENIKQHQENRDRFIGMHLKQLLEEAELKNQFLTEQTGIPDETIQEYESGNKPIPLPVLEKFSAILNLDIQDFYENHGLIGEWHMEKESAQILRELPEPVLDFISKPVNQPYLELAIRLSEMQTEKLRTIAECLLEITF